MAVTLGGMVRTCGGNFLLKIGTAGWAAKKIGSILVVDQMQVLKGRKGRVKPDMILNSTLRQDLVTVQVKNGIKRVVIFSQWGMTW